MNYEKVWTRAVDWFADHNVTIEKIEKSSGLLTAKYLIETNDNYLDCGQIKATGVLGDPNIERYGSLNLTVRQVDENSTKVNVNFFGELKLAANDAWDGRLVTSNGKCVSTGNLEKVCCHTLAAKETLKKTFKSGEIRQSQELNG